MRYCSTRGKVKNQSFEDVLFNNYTSIGGMFMPEFVPEISQETLQYWSKLSYVDLCKEISRIFIDDKEIPTFDLNTIINAAFTNVFDHEDIVPVIKVSDKIYVAEMWHGPSLAFKDLALSCVAQFMAFFNAKQSRHVTILVATSGDTGSAAIESVRKFKNIDIICMFPRGACSAIQELQMTTVIEDNVHVFSSEGTSDDMDVVLRSILKDSALVRKYNLCTINSANWARIMIQIVHYFHVYFQLCDNVGDKVHVIVPTGGMGNVTAGCIAYLMGLPIEITCATNINDTVHRAITFGEYFPKEVSKTIAPAMDIQVPSNFERIIFLFAGVEVVKEFVCEFEKYGKANVPEVARKKISSVLCSCSVTQNEIMYSMKKSWIEWNYLVDPHTATGIHVACTNKFQSICGPVILSTAHIDKFLETVALLDIPHEPMKSIQSLKTKPTKYSELKKGENWREILLKRILNIQQNYTNSC